MVREAAVKAPAAGRGLCSSTFCSPCTTIRKLSWLGRWPGGVGAAASEAPPLALAPAASTVAAVGTTFRPRS